MKKTLIALLALGSVAMAATKENIDTTDTNLVSYWNFTDVNGDTKNTITWNDAPEWNQAGGYGIMSTGSNHPYTENANLSGRTGFTFSFDVKDITSQVGSILTATTKDMDAAWRALSVDVAALEEDSYPVSAWFHGAPDTKITTTQPFTEWTTVTLVGSNPTNNTFALDFYIDGEKVGTQTTEDATNFLNEKLNKVQIGYFGNSAKGANFSVDNILVYNKALSAAEVKGLIANNVPEPTTGALSLLALAGLCIRRRK